MQANADDIYLVAQFKFPVGAAKCMGFTLFGYDCVAITTEARLLLGFIADPGAEKGADKCAGGATGCTADQEQD